MSDLGLGSLDDAELAKIQNISSTMSRVYSSTLVTVGGKQNLSLEPELLQERRLRTTLPELEDAPGTQVKKHHQLEDVGRLPPALGEGQVMRLRDKSWSKKAVVQRLAAPRSYNVVTEDGPHLRRNRQHLLTTGESFQPGSSESDNFSDEDQGNKPAP
ncbi:hypothetical protein ISCGN_003775 [Ixodes scapularis]